jgi:hypothetical protein
VLAKNVAGQVLPISEKAIHPFSDVFHIVYPGGFVNGVTVDLGGKARNLGLRFGILG